jgi:hypothetical protein
MSKPTGGKPGRPPRPTPAAILRAPRPADPIAAIVWDMAVESAKPEPNATRSGLLREQLSALTRAQDRADGIAKDEQRIDLEAALKSITDLETWADDDEEMIRGLQQGYDELRENMTVLEAKVASTIAAAAEERRQYLAACPACAAGTVTISELQGENGHLRLLAERCAEGRCPSSQARQVEIDRLRGPAQRMGEMDAAVKEIEDARRKVVAAREQRAAILARAREINARPKMTASNIATGLAFPGTAEGVRLREEKAFFAENAELIAEDSAAREKAEAAAAAKREHQNWIRLREHFGPTRLKVMLTAKRYEEIFGPDPE